MDRKEALEGILFSDVLEDKRKVINSSFGSLRKFIQAKKSFMNSIN